MLITEIMCVWAIVVLIAVACCIGALAKPRNAGTQTRRKALFDFSANQEEGLRVQRLIGDALAGSKTDSEFESHYKRLTGAATGLAAEDSWAWFCRELMNYRRAGEIEASPLTLAQRYYDDIPHRYGLKAEAR